MATLDVNVEISPGSGHTYQVSARAPGGEADATMRLPGAAAELDRRVAMVRDTVLASSTAVRRTGADDQVVREFGR